MAVVTPNYSARTTIAMDLANLATSSSFVAGRECAQIDNTLNKYMDAQVRGAISVGTTPAANSQIVVFGWGANQSLATVPIDTLAGTDAARTLTNGGIVLSLRRLAVIQVQATTSDVAYPVLPCSLAAALGLTCLPPFFGVFVAHNTGSNLRNNVVNTNSLEFVGVKYDVT